jgi:catechol 2,3-dioxygenase-like lactoylglutathione lyase family enzyme
MKASVQFYRKVLGMELIYGGEHASFSSLRALPEPRKNKTSQHDRDETLHCTPVRHISRLFTLTPIILLMFPKAQPWLAVVGRQTFPNPKITSRQGAGNLD